MAWSSRSSLAIFSLLSALLLGACGGSGSDSTGGNGTNAATTNSAPATTAATTDSNAPALTGNSATDGFNWFNYRRQQIGLRSLSRNTVLDTAAQNHSNYQKINDTITHDEDPTKAGFTGATEFDRVAAAGYRLTGSYALGEVISSTTDGSGVNAADALITAIYHRFLVFEPMFHEGGAGSATVPGGYMYFTVDFASSPLDYNKGLSLGGFVTYPFANQTGVPINFFSDYEIPDPVPNKNEVGYPISVHANINATIAVTSFTVRPHGGNALTTTTVQGETHSGGTGPSAVAIIPLDKLAPATIYDVQFTGTISGIPVSRSWSFTTRS
jgi:uncharacterized protein YkwD